MRVLIVEDDRRTCEFLEKGFHQEGFSIEKAFDGAEGLFLACNHGFDVILMDVMLPKMDGITVIKRLRQRLIETPVLLLSARGAVDDRIEGLRAGGDDYLVKPFSFAELVARMESLVRRATKAEHSPILTIGEITVDQSRHTVYVHEQELHLQPREFLLLVYLMKNEGRVLSKTMILDHVWGINFDPQTNVVESRISKLRRKITEISGTNRIKTVRGLGYKFCEPGT
ncbi:Response regulator transcription factor [Sulfidibacter corallicola]|uniref:Response regulator transcription factor n=1 Tax=Sulfidibacter corallicola TaxID=2818388 RepID=A0A8A4TP21_SULCO|nr:response regulator transcription factor [Sulfidibacter corallicola]QTD51719.1 response regulator transcription factor [Sulfidibacter corallicola]